MLHIVNGDSVGNKLKDAGAQGDVLVWREMYTEGPVFLRQELPENRIARGQYMEEAFGIPLEEWKTSAEAPEKRLADFHLHEDIVLWFEHDLFDQTMLSYLLHWFSGQSLGNTKLYLLSINQFPGIPLFHGLGQLSAAQLSTLMNTWEEVSAGQLSLGKKAWEAYTAMTPAAISDLLREDTSALPFLEDAFKLHLSRYPSVQNGLGVIEQTTLELLASGTDTPLLLFQQTGDKHHVLGMGDTQYWFCLRQLAQGSHPLIALEGSVSIPGLYDSPQSFLHSKISLTGLGAEVAGNRKDWAKLNGIHKWFGGVLLEGHDPPWRWDNEHSAIVPV